MRLRFAAALLTAQSLCATAVLGSDITSGSLQIQGVSLEIDTPAVTTGIDIPTTIQTKFGGKLNDAAPLVEGLIAVAELTGPGLDSPIQLKTAPGYRFQIPGFKTEGIYYLQNVRLMKGADFVAPATPSAAAITVANVLQASVKVHQLSPDEMRARGIVVDGRNFNVYEQNLRQFIDAMSKLNWSEHTIRAYRRGMLLLFDWLIREHSMMTIDRVTPAIVFAWRDELEGWNVAASTKQLRLSAVKTFFSMMHRAGVVPNDAAADVEIPKWKRVPAKPRPVPTCEQVEQMIDSAPAGSRDRAVIEVLYSAGLRGCELRALNVEDVDVENRLVHVRRGKGGQPRIVPIGAAAVAALRAHIARVRPKANRAIFALSARSLRRLVARASRAAGAKFSPHRLRHAFATHLLQGGAQLDEVRQLLGHAWLDTTQIYVHVEPRDLAEVHARFHPRG